MADTAALIDAFAEPLLILDGVRVTHANRAARALLGDYVVGEDVRLAIRHPEARALIAGEREGAVAIGGMGDAERLWTMSLTLLPDGGGLVRLEDRSTQQAAERMRTDFVANASHELRTPLAALIGFIETLGEANGPDDAAVRERFLGIMDVEARRMQRLIDDLMSLSRIEVDRFVPPRGLVDLASVVRIACDEIAAGGRGEGRVRLALTDGPMSVRGDAAQLSQLIHNIVGNALKYGRSSAPVLVELILDDDHARLRVTDEGDGIAPEHLPRLTQRFYRVDPGRSRTLGGTGLGLAIVKHVVERHRGRFGIESMPGVGSVVTVDLPISREAV